MSKEKNVSKAVANIIPHEIVKDMIFLIRGQKAMFDHDLASLYGVETKQLKRAVKRNIDRFPEDFMFELTKEEYQNLRLQFGTSSWGGVRYLPYVFTEQGVAMLSSVLNSERAIQVNIAIMRTFTKLRQMIETHKEMRQKIAEMEKKYDKQFQIVFAALKELFDKPKEDETKKMPMGFHVKK